MKQTDEYVEQCGYIHVHEDIVKQVKDEIPDEESL